MSDHKPRSATQLYSDALVWGVRALLCFGIWALSTLYTQITGQITDLNQRLNGLASAVARVETILERDR